MKPIITFFRWFRSLGQTKAAKQDIDEELRLHLELRTAENIAAGMSSVDAAREARRRFGNLQSVREECRDVRGASFWEAILRDIRFALRMLRKNLGFTTIAVLTLALGIGVNTSLFSAFQASFLRPLPYPEAGRIVRVFLTSPHSQRQPHSVANFLDHQAQNHVFERMAALNPAMFSLAEPGQPAETVRGMQTSADLFPLLGIQPEMGRMFIADEDVSGRNNVIILSHRFWLRRFVGDTNILGRTLRLEGESVTVVGVMPDSFTHDGLAGLADVWRPIAFTDDQRQNRSNNWVECIARLKPGVSLAQAQAESDFLAARFAQAHSDNNSGSGLRLVTLAASGDENGARVMWLTLAFTIVVLLIACANLANLQFARTAMRARELAIRGALGASGGRLLRQLLTESLLIALLGGLLGLVLAGWANEVLSRQMPDGDGPRLVLRLNLKVLGFAFAASTFSGLVFGLLPAWLASRTNVNDALKQGARGMTGNRARHRLLHAMVVTQVAFALALLTGAGVMMRGLDRFASLDPGWRADGLVAGYLSLPNNKYGSADRRLAFSEQLGEKLAGLPGIDRIAVAGSLPIQGFDISGSFAVEGQLALLKGREPECSINGVTPGYFETLGMHLLSGRNFTATDTAHSPAVIIINDTMGRVLWPGESPIGKRIGSPDDWQEIVGVVNDVRFPANLGEAAARFQTYRPLAQKPPGNLALALRGNVPTETLRRAIAELDPDMVVNEPGPARASVERHITGPITTGRMLGGFAGLGLFLAGLGIYGVIAGFVTERTNEIGVRMALGAQLRDVVLLVVGKAMRLTLLGAMVGLVGGIGISRLLASLLPELGSNDPFTFGFAVAVLAVVALIACWLPARRAAKVDPMVALRHE